MSTTFPQINPDNLGFGINEMADHYSMKQNNQTNPLETETGLTSIPDRYV